TLHAFLRAGGVVCTGDFVRVLGAHGVGDPAGEAFGKGAGGCEAKGERGDDSELFHRKSILRDDAEKYSEVEETRQRRRTPGSVHRIGRADHSTSFCPAPDGGYGCSGRGGGLPGFERAGYKGPATCQRAGPAGRR